MAYIKYIFTGDFCDSLCKSSKHSQTTRKMQDSLMDVIQFVHDLRPLLLICTLVITDKMHDMKKWDQVKFRVESENSALENFKSPYITCLES